MSPGASRIAASLLPDPLQQHARGLVARVLRDQLATEGADKDGTVKIIHSVRVVRHNRSDARIEP
jgi:hypothetical protein